MPQKPQLLSPRCLSLPPVCETDLLKEGRTPEHGIRGTRPHTATLERAIGEALAMVKFKPDGDDEFDQAVRNVRNARNSA